MQKDSKWVNLMIYERWKTLNIQLLWAYERSLDVKQSTQMGCFLDSVETSAWLVIEGEATIEIDGHKWTARVGQWLFPKSVARHQHFAGPLKMISVTMKAHWPDERPLLNEGLPLVVEACDIPELEIAAGKVVDAVTSVAPNVDWYLGVEQLTFHQYLATTAIAFEWFCKLTETLANLGVEPQLSHSEDERIHRAQEFLHHWPLDQKLQIEAIAKHVGISRRQLDRLCHTELDYTLVELYNRRRQSHAKSSLSGTNKSVKEIAMDLGFSDLSNFGRWFSSFTGRAPTKYRRLFQQR